MSSGISTFTALKLDDKDVNDPNSGFYTTQATQEQIDAIPADAKAPGELIYNTTTGSLVLYSKAEDEEVGEWKTLAITTDTNGNIVINNYPTAPSEPTEGEIYYNSTDGTLQVYLNDSWQIITTSESGEVIVKSHATADAPSSPSALIYYNTDDHNFKAIDDTGTNSAKTIVTTTNDGGYLVLKGNGSDPSGIESGTVYYHTTDHNFKVRDDTSTKTIVTTSDTSGYLVLKSYTSDPITTVPGFIYYNSNADNFRVTGVNTNTIVTTSSTAGYLVVKSNGPSDPGGGVDGEIYYNTQDHAFRAHANGAWNYLYPKPFINLSDYNSIAGSGNNSVTRIAGGGNYYPLFGLSSSMVSGGALYFEPLTVTATVGGTAYNYTNSVKYNGRFPIQCLVTISILGYYTDVGDGRVELKAYTGNPDSSSGHPTGTEITGSSTVLYFPGNVELNSTTMSFVHTFNPNDSFVVYAKHASSNNAVNFYTNNYNITCTTI